MAQPVWITAPGDLGTVQEGKFFQLPLYAYDPDYPDDKTKIYYIMIAGELPEGVRCGTSGLIEGIPKAVGNLAGVPAEVGENVTSKFTVRIYNEKIVNGVEVVDRVNDRTFTLTVAGQDIPEFTTPAGLLGRYFDGDYVSYQINFSDADPDDTVTISVIAGSLPPGLELTSTGLIIGNIDPVAELDDNAIAGFDRIGTAFDEFPFDFSSRSINKNYQFTIEISDGKESRQRTFEIYVYSRDSMTADNTELTADITAITADVINTRKPYIDNYISNLGSYRHDNFYAHQFKGVDTDGDQIEYILLGGTMPPGLHLDAGTGWMLGYIPPIGLRDVTYSWTIRVQKTDGSSVGGEAATSGQNYDFSLTIIGNIDTDVTWITSENLGNISNGEISTLVVNAIHVQNVTLQYRIKSGSDSKLPQGLKLLPSGNISGKVSYETFALDGGTTTFDKEITTRLISDETTFDMVFTFTVEAYNIDEIVNVRKTFTITVVREFNEPCQCLRIEAMPPLEDRDLLKQLLQNTDLLRTDWLYRPDDPWFATQKKVRYEHAYGLKAANISDYINAMQTHHYRKQLTLGEIKTARAVDDNGNVLYEVVYSQIIDDQVNNDGISVSSSKSLKYPINPGDSTEIDTVYPNSLENMRNAVIDEIGKISDLLPRWMLSRQSNGTVLGFVPAWVIAYTIPGKSELLAYRISQQFGTQLNKVDFIADRYVIDGYSSHLWDVDNKEWLPSGMTTFDRQNTNGQLTITADNTIERADDNIWPTADHASSAATAETIFDGGNTRFISSVNIYEYTDKYDKYVLFPQRRIIEYGE